MQFRRRRAGARLDSESAPEASRGSRVLIISASMGAGHDGAARELAKRLEADGHDTEIRDMLDAAPFKIGSALRGGYEFELRHIPSAYDATYTFWYRVPALAPVVAWFVCLLTKRRVLRWIRRSDVDIVVSTYPLATLCLGRLRRLGRIKIPTVNFITDFGVHPLWVHKGVDLNLAVHQLPADEARRVSGITTVACGPMVAAKYDTAAVGDEEARVLARAELGIPAAAKAVLVVAGSWGVGSLDHTLDAVLQAGDYVPVVVCGKDSELQAKLQAACRERGVTAVILGWTDQMPKLMLACDALVENAGGLTSFEALKMGLPVVSFDPIAGHGKQNTAAMAKAGVSLLAADNQGLATALATVTAPGDVRTSLMRAGMSMFAVDGAALVAGTTEPSAQSRLNHPRRIRVAWASATRVATMAGVLAAVGWGGMTTGVDLAAAAGAGVVHPVKSLPDVVYVAVRLNSQELANKTITSSLVSSGATLVVDHITAEHSATEIRRLASQGVDVENGGHGLDWDGPHGKVHDPSLWTRASRDAGAGRYLSALVGHPVKLFVPGRRVNGFDMIDSSSDHEALVVPNLIVDASKSQTIPSTIAAKSIVLINGMRGQPGMVLGELNSLTRTLRSAGLSEVPLVVLG